MKLEGKIKHGIALAIDHNDYVDCDVVYYGGMTIRLVNASYDDLSIAFGPVGSYVDMNAFYTKEEIDNKGYLTEHQDISGKADKVDTYTKAETNTLLDAKANASTTYTKSEVDTLISNIDVDDVVVGKLENDKFYTVTISGLGTKTFSSTPVAGNYNKLYADILTFKLYWYDPKIIQFGSDEVHYKLIGGVDETDPIFTTSAAYGITATDIANWNAKVNSSDLASVATSGSYNDLSDKPDIPQAQVQSDWNESDSSKVDYIKNKPTIPTVPTNVSAFTNDVGYLTQHQSLADYYTKTEVDTVLGGKADSADLASVATSGSYNDLSNKPTIPTVPSNVSAFNNDAGYLTTESDPTVPNHVKGITQQNITNWNNKADSSDLANYYTKSEVNSALDDKQDTIADLATIRSGAALGATAYQKPNGGIPKSDLASSVQTSLGLADSALQQHQDLSSLADGAEYDSSAKKIYLKHGNTRLSNPIDATAFIKDGMIDTVTVTNGNLVISFNTDAGKQPISIPISDIFNANNYYTKTEIDNKGYLTSETDPIYSASVAASITSANIDNWNNKQNKIAPPEVGSLYRSDVSGSGSISIRGTKGTFPHVNYAGTYILITSMQSSTQSYGLSVNFGGNTYTLNTTNGLIEDTRQVTVNAVATWSGSVVGNVAANTIISVKILSTLDEITTVGMTAVTNSYNDLDNKPTIPTVYNGKLTIQKNGTQVATFTANQSGNATANIIVPTKVSELNNDSGFITGYTETDPVFTASVAHGITSSDIANWNSKTSNVGTITGITMNGASKGTSGVVDLGTVITEHQDISGKVDKETGKGLSSNDYTDAEKTKLSGIATGAEVNVQSDWNQTTTTADDYIKNKPSLATVATSGSYSDLSNKPTIPTVNNATLTIQKNGTTVGTFTANASSNVTANISVPTKVSDLTNDSGFLGDADVSYDANTKTLIIGQVSNYVMTAQIASGVRCKIVVNNSEVTPPLDIEPNEELHIATYRFGGRGNTSVTMGDSAISQVMSGPEVYDKEDCYNRTFYISSVTGNITITIS